MNNYVAPGEILTFIAPSGGVVSSLAYKIEDTVLIATVSADEGDEFSGWVGPGVISYEKPGSQAWVVGEKIYWDDSGKKMTTTAGGNTLVGQAAKAVGSGADETTGEVRFDGAVR